jgi:hypothetical protein
MRRPRFTIRSLLALVLIAGLGLAVGVLSVQNQRLRVENARLQTRPQPLDQVYIPLIIADEAEGTPAPGVMLPNGPDAVAK